MKEQVSKDQRVGLPPEVLCRECGNVISDKQRGCAYCALRTSEQSPIVTKSPEPRTSKKRCTDPDCADGHIPVQPDGHPEPCPRDATAPQIRCHSSLGKSR
jgi:hypothetical protein